METALLVDRLPMATRWVQVGVEGVGLLVMHATGLCLLTASLWGLLCTV
jgi:hypothetical protein